MAQNIVDFSGDPSGDQLLDDLLTNTQENILTNNSGNSRPSYAQPGTLWIDNTSDPWYLKLYDGAADVIIGSINTTDHTHTVTLADGSVAISKLADVGSRTVLCRPPTGNGPVSAFGIATHSVLGRGGSDLVAFTASANSVLGRGASGTITALSASDVLNFTPSVANGDILYRTGGNWTRLGIGGANTVLRSDGSAPAWGPVVDFGTWSGTATGVTNISSAGNYNGQWARIGNVVTFSGTVTCTPTAGSNTSTELTIPFPVVSNITNGWQCSGMAQRATAVPGGGSIVGGTTDDNMRIRFEATGTSAQDWVFTGVMQIL